MYDKLAKGPILWEKKIYSKNSANDSYVYSLKFSTQFTMPILTCPWTRQLLWDVPANTDFLCNKTAVIKVEEEYAIQVCPRRYFFRNLSSYFLRRNFLLTL